MIGIGLSGLAGLIAAYIIQFAYVKRCYKAQEE